MSEQYQWTEGGKGLLLAFELLIREYGGRDKLASEIESEEIKKEWRKSHVSGNADRWTYDELQILKRSIQKRVYPVIKGRSRSAVRNKLQLLNISSKGLHF